ncbi:Cu(I)-responsive transcriptional regulator [Inquilinus sp. Marseille-Q2685]|uniref:Cu(I)-responsive transcriptional regulator n=1 Tax=Inquilinus sp. Marseille-Q2685 TaxID=2866581 RepID=UPI001CE4744F|nr:Cu(I)-responsive transcriptional regulator [Inquilinus sp. Marseille-Q2685]
MNIGEAARRSGLPAKTIRYYEEIGLVRPDRRDNNYRDYGAHTLEVLRFLRRSREFGFSIEQCRALLSLYEDPTRCSSQVKALASARMVEIDEKIRELEALRESLGRLVRRCPDDADPGCPIIDELAGAPEGPVAIAAMR